MGSLEARFHEYVMSSNASNEDVDLLQGVFDNADGTHSRKPDYFLFARAVILEKKTLLKDRAPKFNVWLNEQAKHDKWLADNWVGACSVEQLIRAHPDSDRFRRKAVEYFYKSFRNDVMRDAAKQLKISKERLSLHRSVKGLVILNQDVQSFEHKLMVTEINNNLGRRKNGIYECDGIDFVLLISELKNSYLSGEYPCDIVISENAYNPKIIKFHMRSFLIGWSTFNGRPVREIGFR